MLNQRVSLSALAAAIENGGTYIEPKTRRLADVVRDAGIPDFCNRFLPENQHLNRTPAPMKAPGPKEASIRTLRTTPAPSTPTASAPAQPAAETAKPVDVATPTESVMRSKSNTAKKPTADKAKGKTKPAAKGKATAARSPARGTTRTPTADQQKQKDAFIKLVTRETGATFPEITKAVGWKVRRWLFRTAEEAGYDLTLVREGKDAGSYVAKKPKK